MPSWKKVIISGSDAALNSLIVTNGITGSLLGTASYSSNSDQLDGLHATSFVLNSQTSSMTVTNASTASNITPAITNNTNNYVLTATGGGTINGEANLTFDGTTLAVKTKLQQSNSTATGLNSHAEGGSTQAIGDYSHAEGANAISLGRYSHAEGATTLALGGYSHAEGYYTSASGDYSHAEGENTQAIGASSHAEGSNTVASGVYSHAEGSSTIAFGEGSHAEGDSTFAGGVYSHAAGYYTSASGNYQSVIGAANQPSTNPFAFIIGNGPADLSSRSNLIYASGSRVEITGSLFVSRSDNPLKSAVHTTPGTKTEPAYTFIGDEDTGIFKYTTNAVALTGGGNIGVIVSDSELRLNPGTTAAQANILMADNDTIPLISKTPASSVTVGTATNATNATNTTNITITNDTSTNATYYPVFVSTTSGNTAARVDSSTLTYNPSTNTLTVPLVNSSTAVRGGNGSATSPAFSFSGDTNTGMYNITADTLGFSTAGSERMRINSSGYVSIGNTTSPALLQVGPSDTVTSLFVGEVPSFNRSGGYFSIFAPKSGSNFSNLQFSSISTSDGESYGTSTFYCNAEEGFQVNSIGSGSGAGASYMYLSPSDTGITVSNSSNLNLQANNNSSITIGTYTATGGAINLLTRGTSSLYIDTAQRVGIGKTTGINAKLDINGNTIVSGTLDVNGIITAIGGNSTQWNSKQEALVSGTNIKTLNGNNVLGSGDLSTKGIHTLVKPAVGETTSFLLYGQTIGNVVGQANRLIAVPYIPATTITCSSLYINISTALAGSNARILIYSDDNGKPGTKIYESANLDCSTTGIKTATTTQTFNAGTIYWICSHSSSTQTFSSANPAALIPINVSGISVFTSYYITPTFGSAPTTFGTGTFIQLALPFIGIKI